MRWLCSEDAAIRIPWDDRWKVPEAAALPNPVPPGNTGGSPATQATSPQPATGGVPAGDGQ
eukprot:2518943-Lingulodinium_polyedra.AAC.1